MVAVRADLLNAQANLQIEQEQSSMLRQEIDHLQQLIDRVEVSASLGTNWGSGFVSDVVNIWIACV